MKVFHLSHIDLDGYGAQFISRYFFDDVEFYNANYGREVVVRLQSIFTRLDTHFAFEERFRTKTHQSFLILITDLNLTPSEAKYVYERVNAYKLQQKDVSLLLLDHHISGEECAKMFDWYHLDSSKCATKITFETLQDLYPKALESTQAKRFEDIAESTMLNAIHSPTHIAPLTDMVEMINSVDIWREDGYGFEFGKVALGLIAGSNELNRFMFDKPHRAYKFNLLEAARSYLGREKGAVEFDNAIFVLKKCALEGDPDNETMDHITSTKQAALLGTLKEQCTIHYRDKVGFLSYSMGGISVLANLFLRQNPEYDFYMDINARGNVSLRANGGCDVCALSKELFNGGGHKNAAGGKMEGFRESFFYDEIKAQVQSLIANKTT